jgi:hypothetical protein
MALNIRSVPRLVVFEPAWRNWQTRTTQKLVRQNCNSLQQKPKAKQAFSRCPEVAFKKILRGTPA